MAPYHGASITPGIRVMDHHESLLHRHAQCWSVNLRACRCWHCRSSPSMGAWCAGVVWGCPLAGPNASSPKGVPRPLAALLPSLTVYEVDGALPALMDSRMVELHPHRKARPAALSQPDATTTGDVDEGVAAQGEAAVAGDAVEGDGSMEGGAGSPEGDDEATRAWLGDQDAAVR